LEQRGIFEGRWTNVKIGAMQEQVSPVAIVKGS
jgi:hypothetical protein